MVMYRYLSFGQAESGLNSGGKDRTAQHICCDNHLYTRGDFSVKPHPILFFFSVRGSLDKKKQVAGVASLWQAPTDKLLLLFLLVSFPLV